MRFQERVSVRSVVYSLLLLQLALCVLPTKELEEVAASGLGSGYESDSHASGSGAHESYGDDSPPTKEPGSRPGQGNRACYSATITGHRYVPLPFAVASYGRGGRG